MKLSLIICTYMRPEPCKNLLESIKVQTLYPDEILIIDGSRDEFTKGMIESSGYENVQYFKVPDESRGLTRQRNYGLDRVDPSSKIICYVDDDTILEPDYFENIVDTFEKNPLVAGVGGVAINENKWLPAIPGKAYDKHKYYCLDGFVYRDGQRNVIRNYLGLNSPLLPGCMPDFSHGRTSGYPLNGKQYEVDLLIGMSFAFRHDVFNQIRFSQYFEGYGLYEDADFSLRAKKFGKNIINTKVRLSHFHDPGGRPDKYKYGKMVVRNGWYVWRVGYPKPSVKAKIKWHAVTLLLATIRLGNSFTEKDKKEAFREAMGRYSAWLKLLIIKPQIIS
ncbi:glycosyltransferase family 2 protein [Flavobacterium silvaticum]|uniref:Glycosyltransferase family 2 protein n=1 Tax=Flavobacterium silvaticum TaxID=1852020 RepID=A0A972FPJ3_9FLAO|nr:glycosyltransferase family A protein [Flavobacterium silvaticum]NMH29477.1 glycosyltransferase family 2 protein [Flavobacterium silvaticum]